MRSKNTTRQSLLSAGAQEFAQLGYQKARIVEICRNAETNPASINYYFGSKSNFYIAVWEHLLSKTVERESYQLKEIPAPEECRAMLRAWMLNLFGANIRKSRALHLRNILIYREMADPSEMFQELFTRFLEERANCLEQLIRGMNGDKLSPIDGKIRLLSMIANISFFMNNRPLEQMLLHQKDFEDKHLEKIVDTLLDMMTEK